MNFISNTKKENQSTSSIREAKHEEEKSCVTPEPLEDQDALWWILGEFESTGLDPESAIRIKRSLIASMKGVPFKPRVPYREWAIIGAATLLGICIGGLLGLDAVSALTHDTTNIPSAQITLLDTAHLVFDVAPPETPASKWLIDSYGGTR